MIIKYYTILNYLNQDSELKWGGGANQGVGRGVS